MTENSKKVINEEMSSLPKEVQDAINVSGWEKISEEIGKKYLLDEDEINTLQLETASFLLGLIDEDLYPVNIEDEVGTSKEEAEKISGEIFEKIVTPINNTLTENIKKNLAEKDIHWKQNLDFVLSGGDYSAFITPTVEEAEIPVSEANPNPPTLADIKAGVQKTNAPANISKMTDMKSKFVI